jgi:hypothetical protein
MKIYQYFLRDFELKKNVAVIFWNLAGFSFYLAESSSNLAEIFYNVSDQTSGGM